MQLEPFGLMRKDIEEGIEIGLFDLIGLDCSFLCFSRA